MEAYLVQTVAKYWNLDIGKMGNIGNTTVLDGEVGKTCDGQTSVTVKMGKTRDGTVLKIRDGLTIIRDKFAL